eukprot:11155455-Lingulodinium_polyedra.AAC.1
MRHPPEGVGRAKGDPCAHSGHRPGLARGARDDSHDRARRGQLKPEVGVGGVRYVAQGSASHD